MAEAVVKTEPTQADPFANFAKITTLRNEILAIAEIKSPGFTPITSQMSPQEKAAAEVNNKLEQEAAQKFQSGFTSTLALAQIVKLPALSALGSGNFGKVEIPDHIPENLKPLIKLTFSDPKKTEGLAKLLAKYPEAAEKIAETFNDQQSFDGEGPGTAETSLKFALDNQNLLETTLKNSAELNAKLDNLEKNNPDLKSVALIKEKLSGQKFDSSILDKGKLSALNSTAGKVSGVLDVLSNPAYKKTVAALDTTLTAYLENGDINLAATDGKESPLAPLMDKNKLEAFVKTAEGTICKDHPKLITYLAKSFDPAQNNTQAGGIFMDIYNHPERLAALNDNLNKNKDAEALLTGEADLMGIMGDIPGFFARNRSIISAANDPTVANLLADSNFAKACPDLYKKITDGTAQKTLEVLGMQDKQKLTAEQQEKEDKRLAELRKNPLMALLTAFMAGDFGTIMTVLSDLMPGLGNSVGAMFAGQQPQQQQQAAGRS